MLKRLTRADVEAWVRAAVVVIASALAVRYLGVQLPPPTVSSASAATVICPCHK